MRISVKMGAWQGWSCDPAWDSCVIPRQFMAKSSLMTDLSTLCNWLNSLKRCVLETQLLARVVLARRILVIMGNAPGVAYLKLTRKPRIRISCPRGEAT